jgi:hypothetical protein
MAIKTFTTGEVLTAADTNSYLANSGLVYITAASFSASSVAIDNCFTAAYQNYRIVVAVTAGAGGGAQVQLQLRVGGSTTGGSNYQYYYRGITYGAANDTANSTGTNNWFALRTNGAEFAGSVDIQMPQAAEPTFFQSLGADTNQTFNAGGFFNAATQFDGFALTNSGGNSMTGIVRIYGYRQA